jgi:hypothetical protein
VALACSQVTNAERLMHETLAFVSRKMLRSIRVSLKKEGKVCLCVSGFLQVPLLAPIFVCAKPISG